MRILLAVSAAIFTFTPFLATAQSEVAGTVVLVTGQARATTGDSVRPLSKGTPIYAGDVIETQAASYASILFSDEGSVVLRPNSRFAVERYHLASAAPAATAPAAAPAPAAAAAVPPPPASAGEASFFRLLKGGLRAISGLIAKRNYDHYNMQTPIATIGIRGTQYVLQECAAECAADPTVLKAVPAGSSTSGALVSGVEEGRIVVTSVSGASQILLPGQYLITLADGSQYLLSGLPAFLGSAGAAAAGDVPAGAGAAGGAAVGRAALIGIGVVGGVIAIVAGDDDNGGSTSTSTTTGTSTTSTGTSTH